MNFFNLENVATICKVLRPFARAAVALVLRHADGRTGQYENPAYYFECAEKWLTEFRNWNGK